MATIIDLGKLRFHFAGEWAVGTTYEINDIVKYGGNVYCYTNVVRTAGNLPTDIAYWVLMVEGFKFREVFDVATSYRVGDGVAHGGVVYVAIADSVGQTPPNATYWSQFADGIQWEGNYLNVSVYQANDVVKYGAQAYIAKQDTTGNLPTDPTYWDPFVSGVSPEGIYNAGANYVPGDLVAYGAYIYRCTVEAFAITPTDPAYWELFQTGNAFKGVYNPVTPYLIGETVRFGGNTYQARVDVVNKAPDINPTEWAEFTTGVNARGAWVTATAYAINDVINYGGNTYIVLVSHTSGIFADDLTANKWVKFNSGVRYMGAWSTGTAYLKDDIVSESVSTYIAVQDHVAGSDFFIDNTNGKWNNFVVGAAYVLPDTANNAGKYLQTPDGVNYSWQFSGANDKIFYVSEDPTSSIDDSDHGQAVDYAFASIRFACDFINADVANRTPATIFVKDGTYSEQLPIHIPVNVTIVGDGQRNCIVQPDTTTDLGFGAGISDDGVTPNNEQTMFFVNTGTMIEGLNLKGLTGFSLGPTPTDPTGATIKGVFFRLEPGSTILKSPYIKESSAFSSGGVGAIVDGSVVAAGTAGSMVFHTFTQVHDGGIGFWIKDNGLSEIVSCFTYYCSMGYVSSGGGKIRSLNGNNSYGTYGTISTGFDTNEVPNNGYMYGDTFTYDPATLGSSDGFTVGDTLTGPKIPGGQTRGGVPGYRQVQELTIAQQGTIKTKKTAAVTDITNASPGVVTASGHGFLTNSVITFDGVGGMGAQVNGAFFTITVIDADTFSLGVDTSGYGTYTSGGTAIAGAGHGLADGDMVSFENINEAAWSNILGADATDRRTWYADVQDSDTFKLTSNFDLTNYLDTRSLAGWGFVIVNFTDATRSNPVRVTAPGHNFVSGNLMTDVNGVVGMIELNGNDYYVSVVDANTIDLYLDEALTSGVNGVGYSAYTSGGSGTRTLVGTALSPCDIIVADEAEATVKNIQTNLVTNHRVAYSDTVKGIAGQTVKVNVGPPEYNGTGNRYYYNGWINLSFNVYDQRQYIFEQNDASNTNHPLYISTIQGDIGGANVWNTGVTYWLDGIQQTDFTAYITNFSTATKREVRFKVPAGQSATQARLYLVCNNHSNMGTGSIYLNAASNTAKERFIGNHPIFLPYPNGTVLTAQDGQVATVAGNGNKGQFGFSLVLGGLQEIPREGGSIQFTAGPGYDSDNTDYLINPNLGDDDRSYIITTVSGFDSNSDPRVGNTATITLSQEKLDTDPAYYGQHFNIRYNYSQVRMTGHDFLSIGTGGKTTTNYPGEPTQAASQGNEVTETLPGRVYYASTDQDGNFRVGNFFRIDQATGRATLDASAFDLSGLTSLRLGSIGAQLGESINEFSADGTLSGNSNTAVPTEQAVKTYVDVQTASAVAAADNALLGKAWDDSDTTYNASGQLTGTKNEGITYSNIVYDSAGEYIVAYREVSPTGTTQDIAVTYDAAGLVTLLTATSV